LGRVFFFVIKWWKMLGTCGFMGLSQGYPGIVVGIWFWEMKNGETWWFCHET
jgi:hypothetical protein